MLNHRAAPAVQEPRYPSSKATTGRTRPGRSLIAIDTVRVRPCRVSFCAKARISCLNGVTTELLHHVGRIRPMHDVEVASNAM